MKINPEIKERIHVELEIFKVIVIVIITLTGGVSILLINIYYDPYNILLKALSSMGFIFLICFAIFAISRYFIIRKLLNKLKINEK